MARKADLIKMSRPKKVKEEPKARDYYVQFLNRGEYNTIYNLTDEDVNRIHNALALQMPNKEPYIRINLGKSTYYLLKETLDQVNIINTNDDQEEQSYSPLFPR